LIAIAYAREEGGTYPEPYGDLETDKGVRSKEHWLWGIREREDVQGGLIQVIFAQEKSLMGQMVVELALEAVGRAWSTYLGPVKER
jgi:hypothetical protein